MERDIQTHQTDWQGIALSVSYERSWLGGDPSDPYSMAHIEVRGPCPLPITETGYRSHFCQADLIEGEGGPVAYVLAWLDHEAGKPAWRKQQAQARQLSLFE